MYLHIYIYIRMEMDRLEYWIDVNDSFFSSKPVVEKNKTDENRSRMRSAAEAFGSVGLVRDITLPIGSCTLQPIDMFEENSASFDGDREGAAFSYTPFWKQERSVCPVYYFLFSVSNLFSFTPFPCNRLYLRPDIY